MLSSKGEAKQEARFAARLDVLAERVDTLASTVATTASAMAKKDGEIASLRRDLTARDEALQALAAQTRAGGPAIDGNELRSLRNAVAALTSERAQGGTMDKLEDLAGKVGLLGQRLETLSSTVSTTAAGIAAREGELAAIREQLESTPPSTVVGGADPALEQRLDDLAAQLTALKANVEQRAAEPDRASEELRTMLATLLSQVEALSGLRSGVTEEQLDERFAETDGALAQLSGRIDALQGNVESAAASLGDKEHELAALHHHFTESTTRIESVVDDIREALSAFREMGSTSVDDLTARIEKIESTTREAPDARDPRVEEIVRRIDVVDQRVATVATEVARAKTLWPVALRSLEARLDDAMAHTRLPESTQAQETRPDVEPTGEPSDDLLAGLRDSLQAMETVAAEMARASDTLGAPDGEPDASDEPASVAAGGATIVPLRTGEP